MTATRTPPRAAQDQKALALKRTVSGSCALTCAATAGLPKKDGWRTGAAFLDRGPTGCARCWCLIC